MLTFPATKKSIKGLAIIDDQATLTQLDRKVIHALGINSKHYTEHALNMVTVTGTKRHQCYRIKGLQLSAVHTSFQMDLPVAHIIKETP